MEKKENAQELQTVASSELQITDSGAGKKPFVEPEISVAVDVFEATTFQAAVTTGATN